MGYSRGAMMTLYHLWLSPGSRQIRVVLHEKGLDYDSKIEKVWERREGFLAINPSGEVPALIDGGRVIAGAYPIAEYLDERYPEPKLMPTEPKERARARWLEEFADTRLGDVFIWGLFYPKMVHPRVWGEPGDQQRIENSLTIEIPAALDYLEAQLPANGYLFGEIGLADIAIASFFRNGSYAGFNPDPARWPRTRRESRAWRNRD